MPQNERDAFQDYCEKSVEEIARENREAFDACCDDALQEIKEAKPRVEFLPPCHRALNALNQAEWLRRGDKGLRQDTGEWEQIPDTLRGCHVTAGRPRFVAYCRPISPNAMTWYVSKEHGSPAAYGSQDDPFDSVETACRKIESNCRKLGLEPCGVVLDLEGNIRFAYDPPEPPPMAENEVGNGEAKEELLPVPEGYYQIKRLTRIQQNDLVEQDGEWVSAAKLVKKRAGNHRIVRKKHRNDPHQNTREGKEKRGELAAAVREVAEELRKLRSAFSSKL